MSRESGAAAVLRAGGILSIDEKAPPNLPSGALVVRAYFHDALGGRAVVRLSEEVLAQAQTIEMEVLGFDRAEDRGRVGRRKRRGLGFPAWALVNDPEHARYALAVVKEFKKEARRARSKPGHAKAGIDAIAEQLGKSVPHFLPSFYEEAGRVFIEAGSSSYAAQCFEKAREAERVHALQVEEDQRMQAFLEFALAGAVTIKSLAAYAKELEKGHEPATAYHHFRSLCIGRTLGGLPPWGAMAKDLKRLAKAAGLDRKAEDAMLVDEIAEAPSLTRAPMEFWNAYRKPFAERAKLSPKLRGTLLNLFPSPSPAKESFDGFWLELLDDCGALEGLTDKADTVPDEAAPRGGAAPWLTRWSAHVTRYWKRPVGPPQTFSLLRRMSRRLASDGAPVTFAGKWGRNLDLDLCDAALELGVPLAEPTGYASFDLATWASYGGEEERGRNPVYVAADERFMPLLERALDRVVGTEPFESLARERDGFKEVRRSWLARAVENLIQGALPGVESTLERLSAVTNVHTFEDFPEAHEKLRSVDIAVALARTLRGGLFDELGWPALEEAAAALDPDGKGELELRGAFPYAVVMNATTAIVVGPKGRVLEADLDLPKGATLDSVSFAQGQLMVIFRQPGKKPRGFWTGRQEETFELEHGYYYVHQGYYSVELDDGSVTYGDRALMVGDTERPKLGAMCCDGETFYRREWVGSSWKLREFDPRTGEVGRVSLPSFFEDFVEDGKSLDLNGCGLLPLPEGIASSPLGSQGGLIGWRARYPTPELGRPANMANRELETIDGRRWKGGVHHGQPLALLRLPGDEAVRPITLSSGWQYGGELGLWDTDGRHPVSVLTIKKRAYAAGMPIMLPLTFWHCLEVRDERGSRALRSLPDETARELLAVARAEVGAGEVVLGALEKTRARVAERLPEVTHPNLVLGIVGVLAEAARLARGLEELTAARDPSAKHARIDTAVTITDRQASAVLQSVLGRQYAHDNPLSGQIAAVSAFFLREDRAVTKAPALPESALSWEILIGRLGALAYLAARETTKDEDRAVLEALLSLFSTTIFGDVGRATTASKIRYLVIKAEKLPIQTSRGERGWLFEHEGNDYLVRPRGYYHHTSALPYSVLEHAPTGRFRLFPGATVESEWPMTARWGSRATIEAFLESLEERGPIAYDASEAEALARGTGLGSAEAALLWAGLPSIEEYSQNFLDKELRKELGLKVTEANTARETFTALSPVERADLLAAAMPDDVDALFDSGERSGSEGHLGLLIKAWTSRFGKRVALPQELVTAADKELDAPLEPTTVLAAIAEPASADILNKDGTWTIAAKGELKEAGPEPPQGSAFTAEAAASIAVYLPYLFAALPVGDPIRQGLPEALERSRARLASEGLLLPLGYIYVYGDEAEKTIKAVFDGLGGDPVDGFDEGRDNGLVVAVRSTPYQVSFFLRPARLESVMELRELKKLGIHQGSYRINNKYRHGVGPLEAVERLLSQSYSDMAERILETPVPEGEYETNPLHSANELVREVGAAYDLTEDAAVLYLQTLALIAPTTKAVQLWNGWKPVRYKKAAKMLVSRALLVEAKRARAGRGIFLPGPWEALKSPHPPLESWKLPLYGIERTDEGYLKIPLERFLPVRPLHQVFLTAWQRIRDGDVPSFEEVSR